MNDRGGYRQIISSRDDVLTFGKHKGHSIYHVLEHDPNYILWAHDEKVIQFPREIVDDAEDYSREESEDFDDYEDISGDFDPY